MAAEDHSGDESLWYKDAVVYEVHVRSFYDSNGDGIGDLQGLMERLDYLKDLGVTAIWLLPFYPSPLKDDGYDITDYFDIHPDYGDLRTFRKLLKEAHAQGLKVITEMVLNHTSDRHPWFQKARRSKPDSVWRNFYVWSETPDRYRDARVIFKDFETSNWAWDPVARSYYWHRFYSHQPDLNYDNFHVQKAMMRVIDFWLGMGVDGIRLDAVPYLYEREGTNCENLPETHEFLKKLRAHVDGKFKNRMLLAESNQWPEDAAAYFGEGNECHMAFHFPLMPRMFMAVEMEDRFPVIDILDQTPRIPESCQWALFLRNHDELTLEMVTDEERDYMYRVYARDPRTKINLGIRRRLAPLLGNNRRKIELMFLLLFSLPGTPVVYYGDEIGMGDNYYLGDRNGVRTPMQWSPDINSGFSLANPQELYLPVIIDPQYHYEAVNVANQERDSSSTLWWLKQAIALRRRFKAFGRGGMKLLFPSNPKVMAFIRQYEEETVLVVANLSKYSQQTEIDLAEYAGFVPEEILSRNRFHEIEKQPYAVTLGPYDYYRFLLVQGKAAACVAGAGSMPSIEVKNWGRLLDERSRERLEAIFPNWLQCLGRIGAGRSLQKVRILEALPISRTAHLRESQDSHPSAHSHLLILEREYSEGPSDLYLQPLAFASGETEVKIQEKLPSSIIARFSIGAEKVIAFDGIHDEDLREDILQLILHGRRIKAQRGILISHREGESGKPSKPEGLASEIQKEGRETICLQFKDRFFLKLYRLPEEGGYQEAELTRYLTEKGFSGIPPFLGAIEYRRPRAEPLILGMLQSFVPNEGDAWKYTFDEAGRYSERVLSRKDGTKDLPKAPDSLLGKQAMPPLIREMLGGVLLELVQLLGRRTGELHLALASSEEPDFAPASFTAFQQKSLYQSMRVSATKTFQALGRRWKDLPEDARVDAEKILASEKAILNQMKKVMQRKLTGTRIRTHGNYHLGQLMYTGKDFFIFGFEGEPEHALIDRKLKRSPIMDLASMIMSLHLASYSALLKHASARKEDLPRLLPWEELWFRYVSGVFVSSYRKAVEGSGLLPEEDEELEELLFAFLLERFIIELGKSLDEPGSVIAPLKGLVFLLESMKSSTSMKGSLKKEHA